MKNYYNKSIKQTLLDVNSREEGLSEQEVIQRASTKKSGEFEGKKKGLVAKFFEQFYDLMIIILLIASAISIT